MFQFENNECVILELFYFYYFKNYEQDFIDIKIGRVFFNEMNFQVRGNKSILIRELLKTLS